MHTIKTIKFENYDIKFALERQDSKELIVLRGNESTISKNNRVKKKV